MADRALWAMLGGWFLASFGHFADTRGVRLQWATFRAWSGSRQFQIGNPGLMEGKLMFRKLVTVHGFETARARF